MSPASGADDLQFQKAEFAGRKCTVCNSVIGDTYFQIQGRDACPTCAQVRLATQNSSDSGGKMFKAFLWGIGGAILGSAVFAAVMYFLHIRVALLSIAVGWLVGTAIKKGTEGHSSRKYQIMAVFLTYMAIATSYVPIVLAQMAEKDGKTGTVSPKSSGSDEAVRPSPPKSASSGSAGLALVIVVGLVVALPLIDAFGRMPMGLITLLIVYFGLQQAWKQTAPDVALVAGPYQNTP